MGSVCTVAGRRGCARGGGGLRSRRRGGRRWCGTFLLGSGDGRGRLGDFGRLVAEGLGIEDWVGLVRWQGDCGGKVCVMGMCDGVAEEVFEGLCWGGSCC